MQPSEATLDSVLAEVSLATILADIERVEPISRAGADKLRERVAALLNREETVAFHRHVLSEALAFAMATGEYHSDIPASYQVTMALFQDVVATIQAVSRRINSKPPGDAPASLALVAYDAARNVAATRQDYLERLIREFHPHHAAATAP